MRPSPRNKASLGIQLQRIALVVLIFYVTILEWSRGLSLTGVPTLSSRDCEYGASVMPRPSVKSTETKEQSVRAQQEQTPQPILFPVHYIPTRNLTDYNIFAASWWQNVPRFLEVDVELIWNVEGDAYVPIKRAGRGVKDVRMTVDWLDFSIEHLSRWWKALGDLEGQPYTIGKLQGYIGAACRRRNIDTWMNTTMAIIPMGIGRDPSLGKQMVWRTALQATVASLLQHGVARIVLVGHYLADQENAAAVSDAMTSFCGVRGDGDSSQQQRETTTTQPSEYFSNYLGGGTTLLYWHTENVTSRYVKANIPKGALTDIQRILKQPKHDEDRRRLLGDDDRSDRIRYLYLTESDQILHARLSPMMLQQLDEGGIMIPHRLQPVPHPLDVRGAVSDRFSYLPDDKFADTKVLELEYETGSCCDTQRHLFTRQHLARKPDCGDVWWKCNLREKNYDPDGFAHFDDYRFMRLVHGTNIVSLAGDEWSRRCVPSEKRGCRDLDDS